MSISRRAFVVSTGAAALGAGLCKPARAYPLGLPPGVQLWTVKDGLGSDTPGTLHALARLGVRELELYELPTAPRDFRRQCEDLGLSLVGGHFYLQSLADERTIEAAHDLGLKYIIIVFPTLRSLAAKNVSAMSWQELVPLYQRITLDDYRWNAEQFNLYGERLKRQGLQLGYHNHAIDLKRLEGRIALDELIDRTRPELVVFEMDCGHVLRAGVDPIQYLAKHRTRIQLLHLKDLKAGFLVSTSLDAEDTATNAVLGAGVIDWRRFFSVAAQANIRHWFIEHEGKMAIAPLTAIEQSLQFLRQI